MTKSHQGPWEIVRPRRPRGSDGVDPEITAKAAKVQHIELLPPQTLPERSLLAPVPTRTRPADDKDDRARVECMLCWKTLDQEDADLNI